MPSGSVLQALLRAPCCPVERQAEGVVGAEREAILEPALKRGLDGVIRVPELGRVLGDVAEALVRRAAGCRDRQFAPGVALVPSVGSWFCGRNAAPMSTAFRLTVVAALQAAEAIVAVVADVGDVERRRPGKGHLRAELPLPRGRHLRVVLEGDHRRHRLRAEALAERVQRARCAGPARSRSAGCPGSRTRCCRPDGRRRGRRRRGG